jgi:hypothetical protein
MTKLFGERISLLEQDRLVNVLRFVEVAKGEAVLPQRRSSASSARASSA